MERSERNALFDRPDDGVVDHDALGEPLAAVEHAMADRADLGHVGEHAVLRIGELVDDELRREGMIGDVDVEFELFASRSGVAHMSALTDAFAQTLGHDLPGIHIEQLILQRRAAAVDNQNVHFIHSSVSVSFLLILHNPREKSKRISPSF